MWIGHRKEIGKLTFRALALRRSESRNCGLCVVHIQVWRERDTWKNLLNNNSRVFFLFSFSGWLQITSVLITILVLFWKTMRYALAFNQRVRSFGRIRIWISDLWRSFGANPFSDQWSIESTLVKDSLDHWSEWSANGSSDQWSGAFLWVKDPKLITVRCGFGLELDMYFIYEIHFRVRSTAFVLW